MWYYSDPDAAVSTTAGALQSLSLTAPTTDTNSNDSSGASQQQAVSSNSSSSSTVNSNDQQPQQQQQQSSTAAAAHTTSSNSSAAGDSSSSGSSSSDASTDTRAQVTALPLPAAPDLSSRIFVSIVSYRDPEVGPTVADCLSRAAAPARISIGCVLQTAPGDVSCDVSSDISSSSSSSNTGSSSNSRGSSSSNSSSSSSSAAANGGSATASGGSVRVLRLSAAEAAGPCWARRLAASLWRGESFTLQIDSHMRFRPNWDAYLLHELSLCDSPRPILTSYPSGYELPQRVPYSVEHTRGTLLCPAGFGPAGGDGMLRQRGRRFNRSNASVTAIAVTAAASNSSSSASGNSASSSASSSGPLRSPLWAAGFNFGASTALQEHVQYDPYMRHVFFGEEISMAARLYTHGYDFFAPAQAVVYHLWSRGHRPRYVHTLNSVFVSMHSILYSRVFAYSTCIMDYDSSI
jgi:[Skp1-protein]-hydroxyproline N-acetylglucosaminyltransferase